MEQCYSKNFAKINFEVIEKYGMFEECTFTQCNLQGADLSGRVFQDCKFENCDISLANVRSTAFKDVTFTECKLLGVRFDLCATFLLEMAFLKCKLDHAAFTGLKLRKGTFNTCALVGADFTQADLSEAKFLACDLMNATFHNTILERADLRTAYNFAIDPELNYLANAKFSLDNLTGLLIKYHLNIN